MQILKVYCRDVRERLKQAGIDNPDLVARVFIKESMGLTDADFITQPQRSLSEEDIIKIESMLARRLEGEPVSRILGEREFWGLPFKVTPDVLDSRPDTETLVEAALKEFSDSPPARILDFGTGTGCILIALLHEWPDSSGVAVDISEKALDVARENAKKNGVADRISFIQSNWGEKIEESFDLIVSNPPYIPNQDIPNLDIEVKNHDPILALAGGKDGLDAYRQLFSDIKRLLSPCGKAFAEIGYSQGGDVPRLVKDYGLSVKNVHFDLAGIVRVVEISCGDK